MNTQSTQSTYGRKETSLFAVVTFSVLSAATALAMNLGNLEATSTAASEQIIKLEPIVVTASRAPAPVARLEPIVITAKRQG